MDVIYNSWVCAGVHLTLAAILFSLWIKQTKNPGSCLRKKQSMFESGNDLDTAEIYSFLLPCIAIWVSESFSVFVQWIISAITGIHSSVTQRISVWISESFWSQLQINSLVSECFSVWVSESFGHNQEFFFCPSAIWNYLRFTYILLCESAFESIIPFFLDQDLNQWIILTIAVFHSSLFLLMDEFGNQWVI